MSSAQRRYVVTIAVFAVASLAVILFSISGNANRINYDLPELAPVAPADVDEIIIERDRETVTIERSGNGWLVQPGAYEAHGPSAAFLLDTMVGLEITDVVSVSDDPARFDLDNDSRLRVRLTGNGDELRVIDIGRRAATFGHTFVGVPGDDRILQARGELRGIFDRDLDALRDKAVLSFDPAIVTEIVVTRTLGPAAPEVVRVLRTDDGWVSRNAADLVSAETAAPPLDSTAIDSALNFLGSLSAYRYRYGERISGNPWLEVEVIGDETYTLALFDQDGSVYPARSSASVYDFDMFLFQASLITEPFGLEPADGD